MGKKRPIDKVTTKRLDMALRLCNIQINYELLDRIIDVVELIENKGGKTSLNDISDLQYEWEKDKAIRKHLQDNSHLRNEKGRPTDAPSTK